MNFKNFWLNSCFGTTNAERIEAEFKNGDKVNYTMDTYHLLISDKQVLQVVSLETGEVYFTRDPETRELIYRAV